MVANPGAGCNDEDVVEAAWQGRRVATRKGFTVRKPLVRCVERVHEFELASACVGDALISRVQPGVGIGVDFCPPVRKPLEEWRRLVLIAKVTLKVHR